MWAVLFLSVRGRWERETSLPLVDAPPVDRWQMARASPSSACSSSGSCSPRTANIIVVDQAAALGVRIGWREHARVGVPATVATLLVAAAWLSVR